MVTTRILHPRDHGILNDYLSRNNEADNIVTYGFGYRKELVITIDEEKIIKTQLSAIKGK